jgi:2-polyprenyl-3-methyl-5-hydroxy-6-metoxy-1,4-benzoquinol methylase
MSDASRKAHWETVYATKGENEVSWFQENPAPSLELIDLVGSTSESAIVDIGGGASRLVDSLVARGFNRVTVLDISEAGLEATKARLGKRASRVQWIVADVTKWCSTQTFDVWHDRAAFHFLTESADKAAYVSRLKAAVKPGGCVIIGTFAPDGPERCSGLPVNRYDAASLAATLGKGYQLIDTRRHEHATPSGVTQKFQFSTFRRDRDGEFQSASASGRTRSSPS